MCGLCNIFPVMEGAFIHKPDKQRRFSRPVSTGMTDTYSPSVQHSAASQIVAFLTANYPLL